MILAKKISTQHFLKIIIGIPKYLSKALKIIRLCYIEVVIEGNWFVMETTGSYFLKLADFITEQGGKVCVLNPKTIHHFGKMRLKRAKNDKKDAQLIAQYGMDYETELKKWQRADQDIIHLRQLQSLIALLIQQRTMLINH